MRKRSLKTAIAASATLFILSGAAMVWKDFPMLTMKDTKEVTVKEEQKGVTVHYFWALNDEPRVYYTKVDGEKVAMEEEGVPMEAEGNNWYSYTIPNARNVQLKFLVDGYDYATADTTYSAGEYWIE